MERQLFDGAYDLDDPAEVEFPVSGAFDLLQDPHGGSPRFGSSYLVLRGHVLERTTMSVATATPGPATSGPPMLLGPSSPGSPSRLQRGVLLWDELGLDDLFGALRGEVVGRTPRRNLNVEHDLAAAAEAIP